MSLNFLKYFLETDSISFSSNSSEILLLRDHNGNKAHNLLFLCNPYHQVSVIKDIVSYSLVFYCWAYIFEAVCKIIDGKIYLLTYHRRFYFYHIGEYRICSGNSKYLLLSYFYCFLLLILNPTTVIQYIKIQPIISLSEWSRTEIRYIEKIPSTFRFRISHKVTTWQQVITTRLSQQHSVDRKSYWMILQNVSLYCGRDFGVNVFVDTKI